MENPELRNSEQILLPENTVESPPTNKPSYDDSDAYDDAETMRRRSSEP